MYKRVYKKISKQSELSVRRLFRTLVAASTFSASSGADPDQANLKTKFPTPHN